MKKLLMLLLTGALILSFCACGAKPEEKNIESDDATIENPVDESELEKEDGTESKSENKESAALSQSEADSLYIKANDAYAIFDSDPLLTDASITAEINGLDGYEKVIDDRYTSLVQLKTLLQNFFSDEISSDLLNSKIYAEKDGILYELPSGRGSDITRGKILSKTLADVSNNNAVYVISVENIDPETESVKGTQEVTYQMSKVGDRWIFTSFEPLY